MIIAGPPVKQPGSSSPAPVSALSLYPTLIDLCGLPSPNQEMDEQSLRPLLEDPSDTWKLAIVTELHRGASSVRSKTHRYTRYHNGEEELYDHTNDPYEWNNLAALEESKTLIQELSKHSIKNWHPSVPGKGAFTFDPQNYTWTPLKKKTSK